MVVLQFKGWAQTKIKLSFDQEKQVVYGFVDVEGVNLEGVNPIANNFVTVFVQSAINQKVNPLLLIKRATVAVDDSGEGEQWCDQGTREGRAR